MKSFPTTKTLLRSADVVGALPVLTAEWSLNRYYRTIVDNTPTEDDEGYDIEMFPIDSIAMSNRPTSGINKAVVGQAKVAKNFHDTVPSARYYTASVGSLYKYWQSPVKSSTSSPFDFPNHTDGATKVRPQVRYYEQDDVDDEPVPLGIEANKIVVTIENDWAYPDSWSIQVMGPALTWSTVISNPSIPANGKVQIWHNGTAWTTTKNLTGGDTIYGVRLVVNSMNKAGFFNLIELGAYLELDLSDDLVSVEDSANMGEPDFISPLGTVSSNSGNVILFNEHELYTNSNEDSRLYGLLDKNVKFTLEYNYLETGAMVPQFVLYSDSWNADLAETSVSLVDYSKYFMEIKPRASMFTNIPVQEAVWRICDQVGFTDYIVTALADDPHTNIDVFWCTGEETVWEIFQELSRGTQTAIYFDHTGFLRVKTRAAAFDNTASSVWTFRENTLSDRTELSDIISLDKADHYESNKVKVNYQPTGFSEIKGNIYPMEVVWEPEGTVVLRSSPLTKSIDADDDRVYIPAKDASHWPWKGMVQIDGEWISYEGKGYTYYNASNVRTSVIVDSLEEQKRLDATSSALKRHLNAFTGSLKVTERGLWNSEAKSHPIDTSGWTKTRRLNHSTNNSPCSGITHNKMDSTVTLQGRAGNDIEDYTYMFRGNGVDQGFYFVGTRIKIDATSHTDKRAGFFLNSGTLGSGYYVEIMPTSKLDAKMRQRRNELIFYSMKTDGSKQMFGGERVVVKDKSKDHKKGAKTYTNIGAELAVIPGQYVNIDVYVKNFGDDHDIQVWANGRLVIDTRVPAGEWKQPLVSRSGLFVRGHSSATFEYFYGIARNDIIMTDQEVFRDKINGGYTGAQWQRDWVYETRNARRKIRKKWTKVKVKYSQRFFEEFGPYVHEVREFDVKFNTDGKPVLQSKIYSSNDTQAVCTEYVHDVTGGKFLMANTSRENAVLNGEDTLTVAGSGTSINQKLLIYGRPVVQKDMETIEKTDDASIKRRGIIETEYQSKWTQNETEANRLAEWLTTHWADSDSELTIEAFGNTLFELGDVVEVQHRSVGDTDRFFVVGMSNSFQEGINTNITLRKVT